MGDQAGLAVEGRLHFVPLEEITRVRDAKVSPIEKAQLFAALCRINILYMIARSGSGHIGSSFSSIDIMSWLQLNEIFRPMGVVSNSSKSIFFSSKGHDAPALYSTLLGLGQLDFELIHQLRRLDGLPGHPDISTPGIATNTGSLGMGISKAKGMAFANRLLGHPVRIFVLTGDGELQEGQFWESLISAANNRMDEITVVVDHNKLQSDTLVSKVSDLGDLEGKLNAFGWHVSRCDGNDIRAFSETLSATTRVVDKPQVIIADTVKGRGVSFMEHTAIDSDVELYKFHSGAPSFGLYSRALEELVGDANVQLRAANLAELNLEVVNAGSLPNTERRQALIPAYTRALVEQARRNPQLVALDADLILDTGLIPFQKEFPERFFECGIAEQDMVSQAGGMALQGLLPVVHSFACFLSARPNEQIYNNATERTKIIYVGSLAGVVPSGPGHSHQAVRDISALAAIPNLILMEPSCEAEVGLLLDWAISINPASSYLRLTSTPCAVPYDLPLTYQVPEIGKGVVLRDGRDAVVIAYGPVMLSAAYEAVKSLESENGIFVKLINLPWLNQVDLDWFANEVGNSQSIFSLDNHFLVGGQGDRLACAISDQRMQGKRLFRIGLGGLPVCGGNIECLAWHGFDAPQIAAYILEKLPINRR